jgi:hypothetical protein
LFCFLRVAQLVHTPRLHAASSRFHRPSHVYEASLHHSHEALLYSSLSQSVPLETAAAAAAMAERATHETDKRRRSTLPSQVREPTQPPVDHHASS